MRRQNFLLWLVLFFYFVIFLLRSFVVHDFDFGWHIQAGNVILARGIPYTDPFSYSMPSYLFVDHEWLTNVLMALMYNAFGMMPLVIGFSLVTVGSLFLLTITSGKKWMLLPLFLAGGTLFDFVGVRAQVFSWFFLALVMCFLFHKIWWAKARYVLPLVFLLWANLHGSFGIGIGVLGIVLFGMMFEERKFKKDVLVVLLLSIVATFINPFGFRLWGEFWSQLTDTQLRWSIIEWYPAYYFTNTAFWFYVMLSLAVVGRYWRSYSLTELVLYGFLFFEGLASMRNIPIWVIVSLVFTVRGLTLLAKEAAQYQHGEKRFIIAYKGFFLIALVFFLPQVGLFFYNAFGLTGNTTGYPVKTVVYLHHHLPKQQIFAPYDWGGYLIWKLPEKKVFIDGRMPSWRWQANKKGESNYAFDEYKKVLEGQIPFATIAAKYHISTLLVEKSDLTKPEMKLFGIPIAKHSFLQQLLFPSGSLYALVTQAKKLGWREVYHDDDAVIFEER